MLNCWRLESGKILTGRVYNITYNNRLYLTYDITYLIDNCSNTPSITHWYCCILLPWMHGRSALTRLWFRILDKMNLWSKLTLTLCILGALVTKIFSTQAYKSYASKLSCKSRLTSKCNASSCKNANTIKLQQGHFPEVVWNMMRRLLAMWCDYDLIYCSRKFYD